MTPMSPCSVNSAEAPRMVSDPNQVANNAEAATTSGNLLPASTKSRVFLTRRDAHQPTASGKSIMCAYKLCKVEFRYWGMQSKIERFIHDVALRKTMLKAHLQAWVWQDEWHGLTMEVGQSSRWCVGVQRVACIIAVCVIVLLLKQLLGSARCAYAYMTNSG